MRIERLGLTGGVLTPLVYAGAVLVASLFFYPGYNHATQYVSELGAAAAPHPEIFNNGAIATGVAAIIASLGFFLALRRLSGGIVAPALAGLAFALWGASMIMAGMFPMPDMRHGGYGLGMALLLAPLFMIWALWSVRGTSGLKAFLFAAWLAMVAMFAIMMNLGELNLVHLRDVGLWQRANAVATFLWVGVAALVLMRERDA